MLEEFLKTNARMREDFFRAYGLIGLEITSKTQEKLYVGSKVNPLCRYCGRDSSATTFKNESHAISVFLGNRTLIDRDECDACNKHFGSFVEDHFAKYTLPNRTFARIKGRAKIPSYKDQDYEISAGDGKLAISMLRSSDLDGILVKGGERSTFKFSTQRQPYRPTAVYKTFVKMALALMPKEDHESLGQLKQWLLADNHETLFSGDVKVIEWQMPGPMNPHRLLCYICKAKPEFEATHFKYILLVAFGNHQYQVVIPDPASEAGVNKNFQFAPALVPPNHFKKYGVPDFTERSFFSSELVKGEKVDIQISFESASEAQNKNI